VREETLPKAGYWAVAADGRKAWVVGPPPIVMSAVDVEAGSVPKAVGVPVGK